MATGVHVTGPILHTVSFPGDPNRYFLLGTSKQTPLIRVDRHYLPIMMEQGGYVLPFDLSYQGKDVKVITQLNVFDGGIAYAIGASPRHTKGRFALGKGLDSFRDIGSLTLGNKCYFTLALSMPFAGGENEPNESMSPADAAFNFPSFIEPFYKFPACVVENEDRVGGSGEMEITLAIRAQRVYYSRSKYKSVFNGPLAGGFWYFDNWDSVAIGSDSATLKNASEASLRTGSRQSIIESLLRGGN